jgi:hypothetical protein
LRPSRIRTLYFEFCIVGFQRVNPRKSAARRKLFQVGFLRDWFFSLCQSICTFGFVLVSQGRAFADLGCCEYPGYKQCRKLLQSPQFWSIWVGVFDFAIHHGGFILVFTFRRALWFCTLRMWAGNRGFSSERVGPSVCKYGQ